MRARSSSHDPSPAYCLSVHAGYACRQAGACCTAGWDIPAEPAVAAAIRVHFGARATALLFRPGSGQDDTPILATRPDGACVFFDERHGRQCEIHRDLGEPRLPSACRHFPRVVLSDPRGTLLTLSHFCPTAAALLFADAPLTIAAAPAALTLNGAVEGLDATAALPPLLRQGMLTDIEGYDAWERAGIGVLESAGAGVDAALAILASRTREVSMWSPGGEPLRTHVARVFAGARAEADLILLPEEDGLVRRALTSVPPGLDVPIIIGSARLPALDPAPAWRHFDPVIRRYLATRLFGNWWPYLGLDLQGVVAALATHAAVLRHQIARRLVDAGTADEAVLSAIRDTDLLMVHLSDQAVLARLLAERS